MGKLAYPVLDLSIFTEAWGHEIALSERPKIRGVTMPSMKTYDCADDCRIGLLPFSLH